MISPALAHKQRMLEQGRSASRAVAYSPAAALAGPANAQKHLALMTTALAEDLAKLAALRAGLRDEMKVSPLMDEPGFARKVEAAYREMWTRWCGSGA